MILVNRRRWRFPTREEGRVETVGESIDGGKGGQKRDDAFGRPVGFQEEVVRATWSKGLDQQE